MTPHIEAKIDQISKVVLMPGDPLRAQWIAENFLTDIVCINKVRNVLGFTGFYKNKKITIMASGMGIPSIGIYSYELMHFYKVNSIIRVGSCGALTKNLKLGDVCIADKAYSESIYPKLMGIKTTNKILNASSKLVKLANQVAKKNNINVNQGLVISEDAFYQTLYKPTTMYRKHKALAVEMEAFGLYANALKEKKHALTLLTVSDSLITHESMSPEERQKTFKNMVQMALDMSVELLK
ncbi:purine-nucleoside phosphorylase [Mycoplasmoides alvi]|uniref:purine-nucleoside phosphorylase n=1 Tax=Mycoplasmoides alvi TaxID=78580 RepID=UPI00051BA13D|nr:purine-nucleoside phosphorylase [Mycoplasmoides alvi]